MRIKLLIITLFFSTTSIFLSCKKEIVDTNNLEVPSSVGDNEIIEHYAYTLSYNETHEQADWLAYELTRAEATSSLFDRTDDFREDPYVTTGSAQLNDYYLSGYDRGHLAPAADMAWSDTAMTESFYLSNMSPQEGAFNSGKWMYLEKQVRVWADTYNGLYVISGGVLKDGLPTIGTNNVSVPEFYYKVLLRTDLSEGIAFVMPNQSISDSIKSFAVTIDYVEDLTNINFFPKLDDQQEEELESKLNITNWEFSYY